VSGRKPEELLSIDKEFDGQRIAAVALSANGKWLATISVEQAAILELKEGTPVLRLGNVEGAHPKTIPIPIKDSVTVSVPLFQMPPPLPAKARL
jgi:hypothetical protein